MSVESSRLLSSQEQSTARFGMGRREALLCSPWINHGADDLGTYSSFSPGSTVHAKFKSLAIWETTSMTPPCALLQAES
ncbi:hypothetical protein C4D60_Mb04t05690 [Musa balbisiana]|uniref:Uncharacterized protein n=1 Tax=Musa balbisiana TaxID=52838 RepID=A0A4S8K9W3_MUSBA|nr:hypothetical protein C4D60_Mb04t05690 [Musa balbisiana]